MVLGFGPQAPPLKNKHMVPRLNIIRSHLPVPPVSRPIRRKNVGDPDWKIIFADETINPFEYMLSDVCLVNHDVATFTTTKNLGFAASISFIIAFCMRKLYLWGSIKLYMSIYPLAECLLE
jgi:hypothetical protein